MHFVGQTRIPSPPHSSSILQVEADERNTTAVMVAILSTAFAWQIVLASSGVTSARVLSLSEWGTGRGGVWVTCAAGRVSPRVRGQSGVSRPRWHRATSDITRCSQQQPAAVSRPDAMPAGENIYCNDGCDSKQMGAGLRRDGPHGRQRTLGDRSVPVRLPAGRPSAAACRLLPAAFWRQPRMLNTR